MRISVLAAIVLTCCGCVAAPRPQDASSPQSASGTLSQYEREYLKANPPPVRQIAPSAAHTQIGTSEIQPPQPEARQARRGSVGATDFGTGLAQYMRLVDWKVQCNWVLPGNPAASEAVVRVSFRVLRTGEVKNIEIDKSSGNTELDASALQAIQRSTPFPPLPNLFTDSFLQLHYRFVIERD